MPTSSLRQLLAIRFPGGHVGGVGAVVRAVEEMCAAVKAASSVSVALVLEACHCCCDVGGIGGVDVAGVCLEGG